jgi:hypothetical protein
MEILAILSARVRELKSANGNMHSVDALPRRRASKVEGYRGVVV